MQSVMLEETAARRRARTAYAISDFALRFLRDCYSSRTFRLLLAADNFGNQWIEAARTRRRLKVEIGPSLQFDEQNHMTIGCNMTLGKT
jgi:hypothetical protein